MSVTVAAVVPSYRPDPEPLFDLVRNLSGQSVPVPVAVVDDASPCTADATLRAAAELGACMVRHRRNAGIARSLNDGLRWAAARSATWLLTVDQDSRLPAGYVERLLASAAQATEVLGPAKVGAIGAGSIDDASGPLTYPVTVVAGTPTTEEVIQTGTLWSVDALLSVGGFDESLGIDAVDAGACLALRAAGMHVVLAEGVQLDHTLGAARQVRLLGRSVIVSGHSPERRSTIVRNRLRLFPSEFVESPVHALRTLRRVAVQTTLAVTVEDDRWAKAKASARGLLPRRTR